MIMVYAPEVARSGDLRGALKHSFELVKPVCLVEKANQMIDDSLKSKFGL